jgi:hypothetical protein
MEPPPIGVGAGAGCGAGGDDAGGGAGAALELVGLGELGRGAAFWGALALLGADVALGVVDVDARLGKGERGLQRFLIELCERSKSDELDAGLVSNAPCFLAIAACR